MAALGTCTVNCPVCLEPMTVGVVARRAYRFVPSPGDSRVAREAQLVVDIDPDLDALMSGPHAACFAGGPVAPDSPDSPLLALAGGSRG